MVLDAAGLSSQSRADSHHTPAARARSSNSFIAIRYSVLSSRIQESAYVSE